MAYNEAFYDEEIAPALAEIAKKCRERGMDFFAIATYADAGEIAATVQFGKDAPPIIRYLDGLRQAWSEGGTVNFDSFMFAVMRDVRGKPHSSMVLNQLGVPCDPEKVTP